MIHTSPPLLVAATSMRLLLPATAQLVPLLKLQEGAQASLSPRSTLLWVNLKQSKELLPKPTPHVQLWRKLSQHLSDMRSLMLLFMKHRFRSQERTDFQELVSLSPIITRL